MSSQFSRFSRIRRASVLALVALAACALVPKEPITQQPMTARPPAPPLNSASPGAIYNAGYAGRPLFEDQRPRNTGDIITIVIAENVNATKSSAANGGAQRQRGVRACRSRRASSADCFTTPT